MKISYERKNLHSCVALYSNERDAWATVKTMLEDHRISKVQVENDGQDVLFRYENGRVLQDNRPDYYFDVSL